MTKQTLPEGYPALEVTLFRHALRKAGSCSPALEVLKLYKSLEDIWAKVNNPGWATWLIYVVLGRKETERVLKHAIRAYLEKHYSIKYRSHTLRSIHAIVVRQPSLYVDSVTREMMDNLYSIWHPGTSTYAAAGCANRIINLATSNSWCAPIARSTLAFIRKMLPKKRFLGLVRKLIKDTDITEAVRWSEGFVKQEVMNA